MKKALYIIIAAALALSAFSCENKKTNSQPEIHDSTENVEDPAIEQPFIEYTQEDLNTINVNLTFTDDTSFFERHAFTASDFDFGARLSPCKAEEYHEQFRPEWYGNDEEGDQMYLESLTEPSTGLIESFTADSENFYFWVDFDPYCTGYHDCSIFRYNIETDNMSELYRFSSTEVDLYPAGLTVIDGTVYTITCDDLDSRTDTVSRLDSGSGELVPLYSSINNGLTFLPNEDGRLILQELTSVSDDYYDGFNSRLIEYDFETEQWNEIFTYLLNSQQFLEENIPDYSLTSVLAWKEKPEGSRKYDIVSDYWRVSTGYSNCRIVYASRDRVMYIVQTGSKTTGDVTRTLHTIDLSDGQHYMTDVTALGESFVYYNGYVTATSVYRMDNTMSCFMPELGIAYRFPEGLDFVSSLTYTGSCVLIDATNSLAADGQEYERGIYLFK